MLTTITVINTTVMAIVAAMTGKRLAMTVSTPTITIAIREHEQRIRKISHQPVDHRSLHSQRHTIRVQSPENYFEIVILAAASKDKRIICQSFRCRLIPTFS